MDRRQRKTRTAIFEALISLLYEKSFSKITVGDIIERADIGRATFYAHFETKDFLLKELCDELFCHIFDCMQTKETEHKHIFECEAPDSVFLHLLVHLKKNDNHILELLLSDNDALFLDYFKKGLKDIIRSSEFALKKSKEENLPEDFVVNYIAVVFVETVRWWTSGKMKETPEEIYNYFISLIK